MRIAQTHRKTNETDIFVELNLDGTGQNSINTSVPFLDHMLNLMARHGLMDLKVEATGDIEIDYHHLVEDLGITLGETIVKALGDKMQIQRYGSCLLPMDETLAEVALDLSGRPYLVYNVASEDRFIRDFDTQIFEDFFQALVNHSFMNLHVNLRYGRNCHHIYEGIFKAFGKALCFAVTKNPRIQGLATTKGKL